MMPATFAISRNKSKVPLQERYSFEVIQALKSEWNQLLSASKRSWYESAYISVPFHKRRTVLRDPDAFVKIKRPAGITEGPKFILAKIGSDGRTFIRRAR